MTKTNTILAGVLAVFFVTVGLFSCHSLAIETSKRIEGTRQRAIEKENLEIELLRERIKKIKENNND